MMRHGQQATKHRVVTECFYCLIFCSEKCGEGNDENIPRRFGSPGGHCWVMGRPGLAMGEPSTNTCTEKG